MKLEKLKQWRLTNKKGEGEESPIPTGAFAELWRSLIESVLPLYLSSQNQNQTLIDPALEAVSHIEPEVFQERFKIRSESTIPQGIKI